MFWQVGQIHACDWTQFDSEPGDWSPWTPPYQTMCFCIWPFEKLCKFVVNTAAEEFVKTFFNIFEDWFTWRISVH